MQIQTLNKSDKNYPNLLRNINDCPQKLFCFGNERLLQTEKIIAVVGSREMSTYGKKIVGEIVPELVKSGFVVVSGMALGVDTEVHRCCLENEGATIAVLASGVDIATPKSNYWLYEKIINSGGLIVSEQRPGFIPNGKNFLDRNRIIAAISKATIVIEGDNHSGSLVTAKYATDYGRDVFAVPGRINDENSWAPNFLIKNGACLVTGIEDIKEVLN